MEKILINRLTWPENDEAELKELLELQGTPSNARFDLDAQVILKKDSEYVLPIPSLMYKTLLLNFSTRILCPVQRISDTSVRMFYLLLLMDWATCHQFSRAFTTYLLGCGVNDLNPVRNPQYALRPLPRKVRDAKDFVCNSSTVNARRAIFARLDAQLHADCPVEFPKSAKGMTLDQVISDAQFTPVTASLAMADEELYDARYITNNFATQVSQHSEQPVKVDSIPQVPKSSVEIVRFIAPQRSAAPKVERAKVRPNDMILWLVNKAIGYIDKGNTYYAAKLVETILVLTEDISSCREIQIQIQAGLSHANWTSVVAALRMYKERL